MTHVPNAITHSSLVNRETVYITLTMTVLHNLETGGTAILNAYVMAPNREQIWTVLGLEFWYNALKSATVVRALYQLKSADASFRAHLTHYMGKLEYQSCHANPGW